jgi:hypothetical protein
MAKVSTDANGLILSNNSSSGYKFVTRLFSGPMVGKWLAFADVPEELRAESREYKKTNGISGTLGFENVIILGVYDDVRDAAFIGQSFYGNNADDRNTNLEALFAGDTSVVPTQCPNWNHEACAASIARATARATAKAMKRRTTGRSVATVPSHKGIKAIRADVAKRFPNATPQQLSGASLMIVKDDDGVVTWGDVQEKFFA